MLRISGRQLFLMFFLKLLLLYGLSNPDPAPDRTLKTAPSFERNGGHLFSIVRFEGERLSFLKHL
jgi:hypothetical protein